MVQSLPGELVVPSHSLWLQASHSFLIIILGVFAGWDRQRSIFRVLLKVMLDSILKIINAAGIIRLQAPGNRLAGDVTQLDF